MEKGKRIAVVTVAIGGIDTPVPLPKQTVEYDYHCFTEDNLPAVMNLPEGMVKYPDNRSRARHIKCQLHRFLPDYDYFIYLDGRVEVTSDRFVENYINLLETKDVVVTRHPDRKSPYQELDFIINEMRSGNLYLLQRYAGQPFVKEMDYMRSEGLPSDFRLFASGIWAHKNTHKMAGFADYWWSDCQEFTMLDQATFALNIWRSHLSFHIVDWENPYFRVGKHNHQAHMLTSEQLLLTILASINKGKPLAFVRYGDGESTMLHQEDRLALDHILKRQLGYIPSQELVAQIRLNLIEAYTKADVIGVPEEKHLRREDAWKDTLKVFRGNVGSDVLDAKLLTSVDAIYKFLDDGGLDRLLQGRDTVNYISCRNLDAELKARYGIKYVNSFIISPEIKFTSGYKGDRHFPEQFVQVREWIKTVPCQGNICLVGAGYVGKIYNLWFRNQGGVSLDVGAVFDLLAGKKTRGEGRGLDVVDNKYKI